MHDTKAEIKTAYEGSHNPTASESGGSILGHIWASIGVTIVLGFIVCVIYPLLVYGIGQAFFPIQANGSLVKKDGTFTSNDSEAVGSSLIGQSFAPPEYFHSRPSAAGNGYDGTSSGGTNLGPLSAKLLFGTTKNVAFTVFAADKTKTPVTPVAGRIQGIVAEVTKTTITLGPPPSTQAATAASAPASAASAPAALPTTTYTLDATVADPNTVVAYHGRTIHATTIPVGSIVELKLNDKTPAVVTAINVADQENDAGVAAIDTVNNKLTLDDSGGTVIVFDPKATAFVVNGKPDSKIDAIAVGMTVHVVVSVQMDFDGIADRVVHYCQDNSIKYKSTIPDSAFTDADGLDDMKLVSVFNAAAAAAATPPAADSTQPAAIPPTITPATPLPADAVTASGSGLDPHISPENAALQAQRVADARKIPNGKNKVMELVKKYTDGPNLGILGDAGVNVLLLNIALDQAFPMPVAATTPATSTEPATSTAPATSPQVETAPAK